MEPPISPEIQIQKPPILLYFFMFMLGVTGVIGLRYLQVHRRQLVAQTVPVSPLVSPTPTPPGFTYRPPSQAITGTVTAVSGKVEKSNWNSDDMTEASVSAQIFQSEKIVTQPEATASVMFENLAEINLNAEAQVNFTSLIPDRILFTQPSGLVTYAVSENQTISVRSLSVLVSIKTGTIKIEPDEGYVYLNQVSGDSTFAIVDSNNATNTYSLKEKQRATINDTSGSVWVR